MSQELTQAQIEKILGPAIEKALAPHLAKNNASLAQALLASGAQNGDFNQGRGRKQFDSRLGMFLRCMAGGGKSALDGAAFAKRQAEKLGNNPRLKANYEWAEKALTTNVMGGGGAFVPEDLLPDVIEYLRPMSAIRRINPTILPNPSGNLHVPKLTNGAVASYRGESTDNKAQTPGTGDVVLTFKILDVVIPISRELIMTASPNVDAVITTDATRAIAQAEDTAFIRGNGSAFSPKGLRNLALPANVIATAAAGPNDFANIKIDVSGAESAVANNNVSLMTSAWLMPSQTFINLRDLRNTNGFLFYPSLSEGKMVADNVSDLPHLNGYPVSVSNNIPHNLGGGSNAGELYFAAASEIIIGEMTTLEVEMSTEASYRDASGTLQSAFTRGELLLKLTARHDIALRHDQAVSVITGTLY